MGLTPARPPEDRGGVRLVEWLQDSALERFVGLSAGLVILAAWLISYSSLRLAARAVGGYGEVESWLYPIPIDFTLGGAVAARFLLVRWGAPRRAQAWLAGQIAVSAAVTISGNALHGWIAESAGVLPWWSPVVVSAVPGAAIVGMTHAATLILRQREGARQARSERASPAPATSPGVAEPNGARRRDRMSARKYALGLIAEAEARGERLRAPLLARRLREAGVTVTEQYARKLLAARRAQETGT